MKKLKTWNVFRKRRKRKWTKLSFGDTFIHILFFAKQLKSEYNYHIYEPFFR